MPHEIGDDHISAICRVLVDYEVEFVIIGGVAARLHDTGYATIDVDICPSATDGNLENLAGALRTLSARLRVPGDPEGMPFYPHPDMLRGVTTMTLITEHGPLDLCFEPAGFPNGFKSLEANAITLIVGQVELSVASLDDVVVSKRAAGRPKDIAVLPLLEAHLRKE